MSSGEVSQPEDDRLAFPFLRGGVRVEHDLPGRCPGRGIQALGGYFVVGGRVEHRMQQLVELTRVDAGDGVLL